MNDSKKNLRTPAGLASSVFKFVVILLTFSALVVSYALYRENQYLGELLDHSRGQVDNLIGLYNSRPQRVEDIKIIDSLKSNLSLERDKAKLVEKAYGVKARVDTTKKGIYIYVSSERLDSALLLLNVYRDKLTKDENGYWHVSRCRDGE